MSTTADLIVLPPDSELVDGDVVVSRSSVTLGVPWTAPGGLVQSVAAVESALLSRMRDEWQHAKDSVANNPFGPEWAADSQIAKSKLEPIAVELVGIDGQSATIQVRWRFTNPAILVWVALVAISAIVAIAVIHVSESFVVTIEELTDPTFLGLIEQPLAEAGEAASGLAAAAQLAAIAGLVLAFTR